jgi:hypothetical protein
MKKLYKITKKGALRTRLLTASLIHYSLQITASEERGEGNCEGDKKGRERVRVPATCVRPGGYNLSRLLILAADINPIDVISHLPVMCEDAQIPYVFVPSKEELGLASATKRPTSCVMICPNQKRKAKGGEKEKEKDEEFEESYRECYADVEKLDSQILF